MLHYKFSKCDDEEGCKLINVKKKRRLFKVHYEFKMKE